MTNFERKIIDIITKNSVCVFVGGITILSLLIRFSCKEFVSGDASGALLTWYDVIKSKGCRSLSEQIGDYNILYQFIIYIFTLIPLKALYAYKVFSAIFDYALAIIAAMIVDYNPGARFTDRLRSEKFAITYSVIIMSPLVFLNSSCWAQCDSIYTFFVFASMYAFINGKYSKMFLLYGIAFSFKFQAIFALPLFFILYFYKKKYSIIKFLFIPMVMIVTALPGIFMGRSLTDPFLNYFNQVGEYKAVSMNYNSFWNSIVSEWPGVNNDYHEFKMVAVIFTISVLGIIMLKVINSNIEMNNYQLILLFHVTVYTCVLFLPTMHERYGYIYEITAIILMLLNKKYFAPGIGVILLSCITYGNFLFGLGCPLLITSIINVFLYIWYAYHFWIETK